MFCLNLLIRIKKSNKVVKWVKSNILSFPKPRLKKSFWRVWTPSSLPRRQAEYWKICFIILRNSLKYDNLTIIVNTKYSSKYSPLSRGVMGGVWEAAELLQGAHHRRHGDSHPGRQQGEEQVWEMQVVSHNHSSLSLVSGTRTSSPTTGGQSGYPTGEK